MVFISSIGGFSPSPRKEPLSHTVAPLGTARWFPVVGGDWLDAETVGGRKLAASLVSKNLAEVATWSRWFFLETRGGGGGAVGDLEVEVVGE